MKKATKEELVRLISALKIGGKGPHVLVDQKSLERLIKAALGD